MLKLGVVKFPVNTIFRQQFVMRTAFNDLAAAHNDDHVRVLDRGQTVGNGKDRTVAHDPVQRILHQTFGDVVQCAGGFVQNQYRRVLQYRPRDGNTLFFAAGKFESILSDDGIVTFGVDAAGDKFVGIGEFGSFNIRSFL